MPAWHRECFGSDPRQVIPLSAALRIYHRYRVPRVSHFGGPLDDLPTPWEGEYLRRAQAAQIYGGNAVSFLNSF